jgi:hypothetical protein
MFVDCAGSAQAIGAEGQVKRLKDGGFAGVVRPDQKGVLRKRYAAFGDAPEILYFDAKNLHNDAFSLSLSRFAGGVRD